MIVRQNTVPACTRTVDNTIGIASERSARDGDRIPFERARTRCSACPAADDVVLDRSVCDRDTVAAHILVRRTRVAADEGIRRLTVVENDLIPRDRTRAADTAVDHTVSAAIARVQPMNRNGIIADICGRVLFAAARENAEGIGGAIRRAALCAEHDAVVAHESGLIRALKTTDGRRSLRVVMRLRRIRRSAVKQCRTARRQSKGHIHCRPAARLHSLNHRSLLCSPSTAVTRQHSIVGHKRK